MVAFTDIAKLQELYAEARSIEAGLANFDANGEIISMTISGGPTSQVSPAPPFLPEPRAPAVVSTIGILYPPTMVAAIREQLTQRRAQIDQILADLGVTGLDEEPKS